jgi:hypothetical protein
MPGRYGLQLIIFSLLVDLARILNIGEVSKADTMWWQINTLLLCIGIASVLVGGLLRLWQFLKEVD